VAALRAAIPALERVLVYCRDDTRRATFCLAHGAEAAASYQEAGECDIVVTATTSKEPVLDGEWLRDGAFVCAVGANAPTSRELDDAVLQRAAFVCTDARAQAQLEAGDLIEPVERGVLGWQDVHELQDVVAGGLRGRTGDNEITLFKSNGLAAWDVAAAARVVELAA
jgi:ornithine cyclodeaminase/alanine dehydrogenase